MVRDTKTFLQGQGKGREFYLESMKIDILKKSPGKLKQFNTGDLIPFKVEEKHLGFAVISMMFFLNEERIFFLKTNHC